MSWFRSTILLISLTLAGLAASADRGVADELAAYRVTDPNASFFAVGQRRNAGLCDPDFYPSFG